jgi:hypothetical protein
VLAPVVRGRKGEYGKLFEELKREGFTRVRVDKEMRTLDEDIVLDKKYKHDIEVVVDRLVMKEGVRAASRIASKRRCVWPAAAVLVPCRRRGALLLAGARMPGARCLDGRACSPRLLVQLAVRRVS